LVDFVKEEPDDPKTTGDGKFDFREYDYFTINGVLDSIKTIGSPPHDSTYFHQNLIAMQYYYNTASLGVIDAPGMPNSNFSFKIFPSAQDTAYHLPHKMAYYNPDTEDWGLKAERYFQFFRDVITTADTTNFPHTPKINFADYNHIVVIHAGSDWQHDVFWDTPCDIPGMYIELEDDSVAVNDSTHYIKSMAIVPETISQDFYKSGHYIYGFGALNGEMFHEFGHSLGFLDLYNTTNMYPAVGYWDLMDTGGMNAIVHIDTMQTPPDTLVIEGAIPVLPSAWTRTLIWGEEFKKSGKYVEINSPREVEIDAAAMYNAGNPQFIKIPINEHEYFLLENRETDIDNEGDPAIKVDEVTGRVALYPMNNETELRNHEYDVMLPTYDSYLSNLFGEAVYTRGGLCIWHVDESVIYDEIVYVEGKPYTRFEANMINAKTNRKGVELVEADNIWDIGNPNSRFAAGTPYEPFFRTKPGFWPSDDPRRFHNFRFGPLSKPNSFSHDNVNSLIEITDISNAKPTMSFIFQYQSYNTIADLPFNIKFNPKNEILVCKDYTSSVDIYNIIVSADSSLQLFSGWFEELNTYNFDKPITYPLSLLEENDKNMIIISLGDSLAVLPFYIYPEDPFGVVLNDSITDSPVPISSNKILVPTKSEIVVYTIENKTLTKEGPIPATNPRIAFNKEKGELVVANEPRTISIINVNPLETKSSYSIPTELGRFYPIIEYNDSIQTIYIQDRIGSIYKIEEETAERIFSAQSYNFQSISNISLGDIDGDGEHDIVFTADNTIYAVQPNGAFVSRYPNAPYHSEYSSNVSPIIGSSFLPDDVSLFLPTAKEWTQTISSQGELVMDYSIAIGNSSASPYLSIEDTTANFFLPVSDSLVKILSIGGVDENIANLYWNGYKNGSERHACVYTPSSGSPTPPATMDIYAFPNPAQNKDVRIRIIPTKDGNADIKIYDLAANLLFKDTKRVSASKNNDFVWNIGNVSSGIYFAIVNVDGKEKLLKIGVTK
jgi:M6 family metalloprotease-like protein